MAQEKLFTIDTTTIVENLRSTDVYWDRDGDQWIVQASDEQAAINKVASMLEERIEQGFCVSPLENVYDLVKFNEGAKGYEDIERNVFVLMNSKGKLLVTWGEPMHYQFVSVDLAKRFLEIVESDRSSWQPLCADPDDQRIMIHELLVDAKGAVLKDFGAVDLGDDESTVVTDVAKKK